MGANAVITEYTVTTVYDFSRIRIAQISDLHSRKADDILDLLRDCAPDIIAVTGDTFERYDNKPQYEYRDEDDRFHPVKWFVIHAMHFVNNLLMLTIPKDRKASDENARHFLRTAAKIAPVYLSLGNHEDTLLDCDYRFLSECGITLLDNAYTKVTVNDFSFYLGGMSSHEYEDFLKDFSELRGFKLLMCHHPERFEKFIKSTDIDLTLSGHTHGGQIRIGEDGKGFFVPGQGVMGKYAHGMFFDGRLIVSAGCSNTAAFPRIHNPRELVVVDLKGAKV